MAVGVRHLRRLGAGTGAESTEPGWQPLFDGKTLANWQTTKFAGDGGVTVENGQIILGTGRPLTGITWAGAELPTTNYEIALQAMRVEGRDFFAGVTFPVADSFCSLILGGWGGTVIGLSSINGMDASENETSQSMEFESGRWYNIRIVSRPRRSRHGSTTVKSSARISRARRSRRAVRSIPRSRSASPRIAPRRRSGSSGCGNCNFELSAISYQQSAFSSVTPPFRLPRANFQFRTSDTVP